MEITNKHAMKPATTPPSFRPSFAWRVGDFAINYGVYLALLGCAGAFALIYRGQFLATQNLVDDLGNSVAVTMVVAVGLTIALAVGQIDISGSSLMALVSVVFAGLVLHNTAQNGLHVVPARVSIPLAVLAALAVALVVGVVNGIFVVDIGINSLLATFPAAIISYAIAGVITHPHGNDYQFIPGHNSAWRFTNEVTRHIGGVSVSVLIAAAVVIVGWVVLERTRFGDHLKAAGANPTAALRAGIPVSRMKRYAFLITALTAAIAAYLTVGQAGFGGLPIGGSGGVAFAGVSVSALTAVLIGGAQLQGGAARIEGTLAGALFVGVVDDGLQLAQVNELAQGIVVGSLFIVAVMTSSLAKKRRGR